jgi:hypothetical protein
MDEAERLLRWERAGGTWRVLGRPRDGVVTIALDTCHGEEMSHLTSNDAELLALIGARSSSEDRG